MSKETYFLGVMCKHYRTEDTGIDGTCLDLRKFNKNIFETVYKLVKNGVEASIEVLPKPKFRSIYYRKATHKCIEAYFGNFM